MRLTLSKLLVFLTLFSGLPENGLLFSQTLPEYDEIAVYLEIPRLGGTEIEGLIKDDQLYLPVSNLFDFLRIRNESSPGQESISGFFINPEATYTISKNDNRITYQDKVFNLGPSDLIRTESNLYLKSTWFGKAFGLECNFNFRSLSVTVNTRLELPLIREMRQEEMRRNLSSLKGDVKADTTIGRIYPLFRFGMADWSVTASEEVKGRSDARLNLNLGAMVAGGEATASLYYNSSDKFSEKQQYYLWRFVNNDFAPLRQVLAGKIASNAISSLYNPVLGVQLTNTPTTYRRSFGTYTLSDKTEPGWTVELYVNNVLVNYVKADASGFFSFEVPLVYGYSSVKLKFYGPWGEERTREQNISIPYNFLPKNTFEYTVSAGMVEDTLHSRFSRGAFNYGLTRNITIGGGAEYLSSVESQPFMPFVTTSLRVTNNLLLSGEYTQGVRAKGTLSYRLPSNIQFELNYTWYDKEQKAIFYNYREERKATLLVPLKLGKVSTFQRFSVYQIVLPTTKYTTGEWMISGSLLGISTNLTTYAMLLNKVKPYLYSNLSMSFRLPGGFTLMPQVQYGYTENEFYSARARLEKHLLKNAYLNLSYEKNFRNNFQMAEVGLRYDFSFAQTGVSARRTDNSTSFVQYARGSLIHDGKTKYLGTDNRTNVGRGGISIIPFLDLNNNRKRDPGEPKAHGLNLHTNGGRIEVSERDTTIRILGLEPYTNCFISLDENSFENVAWRPQSLTYSIAVDPDILKLVEIPVSVAGEATGYVSLEEAGELKGIGRIKVNFLTTGLDPAGKTLTEDDGYFTYFGLAAGNYIVMPDTIQLNKLGMKSEPVMRKFSLSGNIEGDIVEGLDFVVRRTTPDTSGIPPALVEQPAAPAEKPAEAAALASKPAVKEAEQVVVPAEVRKKAGVIKDTTYTIVHEVTEKVYTIDHDSWAIQIGAFKSRSLAERFRRMLERNLKKKVEITMAGDYYRVRILDLPSRKEVDENVVKLNKLGFRELWIIHLLASEQQRLLESRDDSLALIRKSYMEQPPEPEFTPEMSIQVGAFRQESNAIALKNKISALIEKPVSVVEEDGYYKVRITGFTSPEEMMKMVPVLEMLGLRDIWVRPVTRQPEGLPERESGIGQVEVKSDSTLRLSEGVKDNLAAQSAPEPTFALQVGVFHRESQALRAKKKIESKLGLPVEIVYQWEYYHVIVTGFFTREETYQYYPELAGIGYPGVSLIMNYRRQK